MALLEALLALKKAPDPAAPSLAWAWRGLSEHVDRRYRLPEREHDDVRQRTLLKVLGAVDNLDADSPGRAEAWLRRVHRSARIDHHRTRGDALMDGALRTTPKDADAGWLERVGPATDPLPRPPVDEDELLDEALGAVLDRVAQHLEETVKRPIKRHGDLQRARVSLLASVRGAGYEEIVAALGLDPAPSRSAVYKWVERGREQVLLPALEGWSHPAAGPLSELLTDSRRADAGKARVARRRGAVSRKESSPSRKGRKKK